MKKKSEQKIIVFDLDETLIHATTHQLSIQEDFRHEDYFVYKRPNVNKFLLECSRICSIAVWSSAEDDYVKAITAYLLPVGVHPVFVWGRSECWTKIARVEDEETGLKRKEYQYIKPLEKIRRKGFKMNNLLIVDDSSYKVQDNPGNYFIIQPFEGEAQDNELEKLMEYIKEYLLKN